MKLIVKSKSWCFNGLYFKKTLPNSIEWTSFEMGAAVFEGENEALTAMQKAGICQFNVEPAPIAPVRANFTPSELSGFKPTKL